MNSLSFTIKATSSGSRTSDLVASRPPMTKFATSEAISWSWRAISGGATKGVSTITLATPWTETRRSPMARWSKTWTQRVESWGKLPSRLSGGRNFKAFSALCSVRSIFFPSSSLSASWYCEYFSTVFWPNSDLSVNKINVCPFVSSKVLSDIDFLIFSTAFFSRCTLTSSKESCNSSLLKLLYLSQLFVSSVGISSV